MSTRVAQSQKIFRNRNITMNIGKMKANKHTRAMKTETLL